MFQELLEADIPHSIEPGVSLQSCEEVLKLAEEYPGRIFPAMGIHPTRSIYEKWSDRKKLDVFAKTSGVIAVGECGLDYHYKREEQRRLKQHIWFLYQLDLAWRLKRPVILHVRDAHEDALRILRWHPARKLGGVIHCFYGSKEIAQQYLELGYHFGIGGSLLQQEERAKPLWEAMQIIPLNRILLETDAPYILPYCKDVIQPKLLRRARNTSLILPTLLIKANENYCFYGNGIQIADAAYEYERLKLIMDEHNSQKTKKRIGSKEKLSLPQIPKLQLPSKGNTKKELDIIEFVEVNDNIFEE